VQRIRKKSDVVDHYDRDMECEEKRGDAESGERFAMAGVIQHLEKRKISLRISG